MPDDTKQITSAAGAGPMDTEFERLLQPTRYFKHPRDVVHDPTMTTAEKRAILSSWASDASVIDLSPTLRKMPGSFYIASFDDVIDALEELDNLGGEQSEAPVEARPQERQDRNRGGGFNNGPAGTGNWI